MEGVATAGRPPRLMTPFQQDLIIKALEAITLSGLGYVLKVIAKVVENVSQVPKLREDLNEAFKRLRALESKNGSEDSRRP